MATITTTQVFYNPVQEFNRDLSIAAIRTWSALIAEEVGDASLPRYRRAHLPCTTDGKLVSVVLVVKSKGQVFDCLEI